MDYTYDPGLRAETTIDAPPGRVWEVLTDFRNVAHGSPEMVTMIPLRRGGLRLGQTYLGVNRRGAVVWASRNRIVALEPETLLAWDTVESGARWIFELSTVASGTLLVQSRPIPVKRARIGAIFATCLLGGAVSHDDELREAMVRTVAHLKSVAETPK